MFNLIGYAKGQMEVGYVMLGKKEKNNRYLIKGERKTVYNGPALGT